MRRRCGVWAALAWAGLLVVAQPADGIPTQEPEPAPRMFNLEEVSGKVFTEIRYHSDQRSGRIGVDQDLLLLREGVDVHLRGSIYDPNLLDWTTRLRIGGAHQWWDINGEGRESHAVLLGYDVSGAILKERPLSARVRARGRRDVTERSFARTIEIDNHSQDITLSLRGPVSGSLMFEHRTRDERGELRQDEEQALLTRLRLVDNRKPHRHTALTFEYEDSDRTNRFRPADVTQVQRFTDQRADLTLTNRWSFGDDNQHRLTGRVRLLHRQGSFEQDSVHVSQRLDLSHGPTLTSFYHGQFSYDRRPGWLDRFAGGEIGMRKSVYESLDITARLSGHQRQQDDGGLWAVGGHLDLDYRKQTPIGYYRSNLTLAREYREEDFEAALRAIRDEAITLTGISRVVLAHLDIDPASIRVTDRFNQVRYIEGIDYMVVQVGASTEIVRLAGGSIEDGETVLVDYSALAARDAAIFTDTISWSHRIDLEALPVALYGHYRLREQSLVSGTDPGNLQRDEGWLVGLELTPIEGLLLAGEYESRRLRLTPGWDAWRVRASYQHSFDPRTNLIVSADYQSLQYHDPARFGLLPGRDFLDTVSANARFTSRLTDQLLLRLDGSYRQNWGRQRDEMIRFGGSLLWQVRQMEVNLDAGIEQWRQENTRGTRAMVGLRVSREF